MEQVPHIAAISGIVLVIAGFVSMLFSESVTAVLCTLGGATCVGSYLLWSSDLGAVGVIALVWGIIGLGLGLVALTLSDLRIVSSTANFLLMGTGAVVLWGGVAGSIALLVIEVVWGPRHIVFMAMTSRCSPYGSLPPSRPRPGSPTGDSIRAARSWDVSSWGSGF